MRLILSLAAFVGALCGAPAFAQTQPQAEAPAAKQTIDTSVLGRPPAASQTDPENLLDLDLSTGGRVVIWLRPDVAPKMVAQVKTLTRQHFYDGLNFHRVIEGFMAQTGDPQGDGSGASKLPNVPAEFNYLPHVRGAVSAARAEDENSANSQFFILFQPRLSLDRKYTVFGRVISGMQYVDAIPPGTGPDGAVVGARVRILHAYIAADNPPPYTPAPPVAAPIMSQPPVTLPGTKPTPTPTPPASATVPPKK